MVALELEIMAKKMDRFGWDRDRGSIAHDRAVSDWMDALQDFPLSEVQGACQAWVRDNSRRMPNEGDIRGIIMARRAKIVARLKAGQHEPERQRISAERAAEIVAQAGFAPRRFGGEK